MNKFYGRLFTFSRNIVKIFYKKYSVSINQNESEPVVYISHHQNLFGPFITLLSFPIHVHCWILHVFLDRDECYKQYANYTFSKRFRMPQVLANILAFLVSRFIPKLLISGKGIPVYRGSRKVIQTFEMSVNMLKKGESIVIFPDVDYSNSSSEVGELYEGFLFIEKYYFKETGKHIPFVPLYASKKKKEILVGNAIYFNDDQTFQAQRKEVLQKIQTELNTLAKSAGDI